MFFLLCRDRDGGEKKTHANRIKYTITTTTTTKRITRNLNRKLAEAAYCPTYFWFRNRFELKSNIGNQNRSGAERILFGWVSDVHTTNLIHAGTENWNQYSLGANANAEYCIRSQPFMLLPSWTVQPPGDLSLPSLCLIHNAKRIWNECAHELWLLCQKISTWKSIHAYSWTRGNQRERENMKLIKSVLSHFNFMALFKLTLNIRHFQASMSPTTMA